jgi:hypothetical protein
LKKRKSRICSCRKYKILRSIHIDSAEQGMFLDGIIVAWFQVMIEKTELKHGARGGSILWG